MCYFPLFKIELLLEILIALDKIYQLSKTTAAILINLIDYFYDLIVINYDISST